MEKPKKPVRGKQPGNKSFIPGRRKKETNDAYLSRLNIWKAAEEELDQQYVLDMAAYKSNLLAYEAQQVSIKGIKSRKRLSPAEAEKAAQELVGNDGKVVAGAEAKAAKAVGVKPTKNPKKK